MLDRIHGRFIFPRRIRKLVEHLSPLLPAGSRVLDVGAGDGSLDALLLQTRPDLRITALEVLVRPDAKRPVEAFDGHTIPLPGRSFDAVLLVDVLHHAADPLQILREGLRIASTVVLKDHLAEGFLARPTLKFMDYVGNAHHGVALPFKYFTRPEWRRSFQMLNAEVIFWEEKLALYPVPLTWCFDRSLHFIAQLEAGSNAPKH